MDERPLRSGSIEVNAFVESMEQANREHILRRRAAHVGPPECAIQGCSTHQIRGDACQLSQLDSYGSNSPVWVGCCPEQRQHPGGKDVVQLEPFRESVVHVIPPDLFPESVDLGSAIDQQVLDPGYFSEITQVLRS